MHRFRPQPTFHLLLVLMSPLKPACQHGCWVCFKFTSSLRREPVCVSGGLPSSWDHWACTSRSRTHVPTHWIWFSIHLLSLGSTFMLYKLVGRGTVQQAACVCAEGLTQGNWASEGGCGDCRVETHHEAHLHIHTRTHRQMPTCDRVHLYKCTARALHAVEKAIPKSMWCYSPGGYLTVWTCRTRTIV
jgi:hypothetical protein